MTIEIKTVADYWDIVDEDVDTYDDTFDHHNTCAWCKPDDKDDDIESKVMRYIAKNTEVLKIYKSDCSICADITGFVKCHFDILKRYAELHTNSDFQLVDINDNHSLHNGGCIVNALMYGDATKKGYEDFWSMVK